MNSRRVTTDAKLASIIHSKADDAETEEDLIRQEKLAKLRLRRACLYGGGARTKVPKTKKVKAKNSISPFTLPGAPLEDYPAVPITNSEPPTAHGDLFRVVQNPTRLAREDPDRICINSTSMIEGLKVLPQPPWYVGYQNHSDKPADGSYLMAAARYGYRGSKQMMEHYTLPYQIPNKTLTEHTPKFLASLTLANTTVNTTEGSAMSGGSLVEYVDEYVPTIHGTRYNSIDGYETPKLWPKNTEYVTGSKLKKLPTLWKYKRETTVALPLAERPSSPIDLLTNTTRDLKERNTLIDYSKQELHRTVLSNPMLAQTKFENSWQQMVQKEATSSLKHSLRLHGHHGHGSLSSSTQLSGYIPQTLLDPSDSMKYSGSTAMIVHSQSTEELKFRLRMEKTQHKISLPFHIKWSQVIIQYDNISRKLKRSQHMDQAILKIAEYFHDIAIHGGSETSIRRVDFVTACSRITFFEDISAKSMSHLYSLFDPMKKDMMRYVEVLLCLVVLDHPEHTPLDKLHTLWTFNTEHGLDRGWFDLALDVLTCCAGSVHDQNEIEILFKEEFRPRCYEFSVMGRSRAYDEMISASNTAAAANNNSRASTAAGLNHNNTLNLLDRKQARKSVLLQPHSSTAQAILNHNNNNHHPHHHHEHNSNSGQAHHAHHGHHESGTSHSHANSPIPPPHIDSGTSIITGSSGRLSSPQLQQQQAPPPGSAAPNTTTIKKTASIQPAYNICEQYLSSDQNFLQVCKACPKLLQAFDHQLSARLIQCYGKDERIKAQEEIEQIPVEQMDFAWIMKKQAPARPVFDLFN